MLTRRVWTGSPSIFFASWVLFPAVFFSLSRSQLPAYVLPVAPAAALLVAHTLARPNPTRARALGLGTAAVLGAMAVTFIVAPGVESAGIEAGAVRPLAGVLGLAALAAGYVGNRGRLHAAVAASALGVALMLWQLNANVLPRLDPLISTRAAAQDAADLADGGPVHAYWLRNAWHYGLEYYLGRHVPEWNRQDPAGSVVMTTDLGMRAMQMQDASLRLGELRRVIVLRRVSEEAVLVRTAVEEDRVNKP